MKEAVFASVLAIFLLAGAGCSVPGISSATPSSEANGPTSTDWLAYHSDALKFSISHAPDLAPAVTDGIVDFSSVDGGPWGYRVTTFPVSDKDAASWIATQTDKRTPFFLIDTGANQKLTVVEKLVATDSDRGRPIYSIELEAVEVSNGMAYVITWRNQTPAGTVPTLMDENTLRFLRSFVVDVPPVSPEDQAWHDANVALAQFLGFLHERTYAAAGGRYDGDLSQLREWNPTVDPSDVATLWKNGCEINGLLCMQVASIAPASRADGAFTFDVTFAMNDGTAYAKDGKTAFPFVVRAGSDGPYLVETMPLYQE